MGIVKGEGSRSSHRQPVPARDNSIVNHSEIFTQEKDVSTERKGFNSFYAFRCEKIGDEGKEIHGGNIYVLTGTSSFTHAALLSLCLKLVVSSAIIFLR